MSITFVVCTCVLIKLSTSFVGGIDYILNCAKNQPECLIYYDGCNDCICYQNTQTSRGHISSTCGPNICLIEATPYCKQCEIDTYWLAFTTYQPPGSISCASRFFKSPIFQRDNSKCACPSSNPYYVPDVGCVHRSYCDALTQGTPPSKKAIFRFIAPTQNTQCPYEYQLCTSDIDCGVGLKCNIPLSNYRTCIPLAARFDNDCNLVTGCAGCIDDCMGTGYGYCIADESIISPITPTPTFPVSFPSPQCERGGCSSQLCGGPGTSGLISTCDFRCEYGCLRFQSCAVDGNGNCGWRTNVGSELDYINCIAACQTVWDICGFRLCADEKTRCQDATCNGCKAANVQCGVSDCIDDVCCGCRRFTLNGRDVTQQCRGLENACRCAEPTEDETYCCLGEEFRSLCELNCGTCYDINLDCTRGPCLDSLLTIV